MALTTKARLQNLYDTLKYKFSSELISNYFDDGNGTTTTTIFEEYQAGTKTLLQLQTSLNAIDITDINGTTAGTTAMTKTEITALDEFRKAMDTAVIDADGWVTSAKILDGTIATVDIANGAITPAKLSDSYGFNSDQDLQTLIGTTDIDLVTDNTDDNDGTITGAIGNTALTTTAKTLSGAIAELDADFGADSFGNGGTWTSVSAAIGTTSIAGATLTAQIAANTADLGATSFGNGGTWASVNAAIGTTSIAGASLTAQIAANTADLGATSFGNGGTWASVNAAIGTADISKVASTLTGAIGNTNIVTPSLSDSLGGGTLSYTFDRDTGGYDVTATTIQASLLSVLDSGKTYSTTTALATAIVNAIGDDTPTATITNFVTDLDAVLGHGDTNYDAIAEVQAGLYSNVDGAAATATGISTALTTDLGTTTQLGTTATQAQFSADIDASILLDPVTLASVVGNGALTTADKNLVDAINELDADLGADSFGNGGTWASVNAAIGTTSIAGSSLTAQIAANTADLGATSFGNGGTWDSVSAAIGTTALTTTASTLTGAIEELHGELTTGDSSTGTFYPCFTSDMSGNGNHDASTTISLVAGDLGKPSKIFERIGECAKWSTSSDDIGYATSSGGACTLISSDGDAFTKCLGTILVATTYGDA